MPLPLADNVKSENTIKSNDLWCESVLTLQHTDRSKLSVRSENYFQKGECRLKTIGGKMTKMKLTKKKVLVGALAVGLIATISVGSLAWFSDEDVVENKFKIADSTDDDPEDIFSIDVKEDTPEGSGDTDGYDYEDILPGDELKKEPYAINTGFYDQYVRAIVTVSDASAWRAVLGDNSNILPSSKIFDGIDTTNWRESAADSAYNDDPNENTITYVFYYNAILPGTGKKSDVADRTTTDIFQKVKVPASMTQTQAALFDNEFKVTVKAQAVQTENVIDASSGVIATDAKAAFAQVGMSIA